MSSTPSHKQVHWDPVVDKFERLQVNDTEFKKMLPAAQSPSPLSSPSSLSSYSTSPYPISSFLNMNSQRSISSSSSSYTSSQKQHYQSLNQCSVPTPKTPYLQPRPLPPLAQNNPLSVTITGRMKHSSSRCLDFDLSLSSKHFGRLIEEHRNVLACEPPINRAKIVLKLKNGIEMKIDVYCKEGDREYLTVGRVLADVHGFLRQRAQDQSSSNAKAFFKKRLATLTPDTRPGLLPSREELKAKEALEKEESRMGIRNVDYLFGHTRFTGFGVLGDGVWELHLEPSQRYL